MAGGAAVAGEVAYYSGLGRRALHWLGLVSSPDHHVAQSGAQEVAGGLASRFMKGPVGWTLSTPAHGRAPQALLICLHGKDEDHRYAFDTLQMPDIAASVGLPLAVAAVDGGHDSYWHRRADGTDSMAMLLQEFLPLVKDKVGDLPRAVMGWSMGGYGALLAAERAPTLFKAVAPASPALWLTSGQSAPGAFDNPEDFQANNIFSRLSALRPLTVAAACGSDDPFYTATKRLASQLSAPHQVFYGRGFHDASYWRSVAPRQLLAIAPALNLSVRGQALT